MFEDEKIFDKVYENIIKEKAEEIEQIRMTVRRKIWATRSHMCLEILATIPAVWLIWCIAKNLLSLLINKNIWRISAILWGLSLGLEILALASFPLSVILGFYHGFKTIIKSKNLIPAIKEKYAKIYKELVIEPMVNSFKTHITYDSDGGVPSGVYEAAEFGDQIVYADDVMYGNLEEDCKFIIADIATISTENVEIKYDTVLDYVSDLSKPKIKNETANPQRQNSFEGVFVRFELPKAFDTKLYLRKDANDKNLVNKTLGAIMPFEEFRVELDYSNFEKIFDVYAYDKLKATQIFTPSVMYELVKFYNEMRIEYEITIKENFVYLRFWTGGVFEPPMLTDFSLDRDTLYSYYELLNFIFDLIHKLLKIISQNSI